MEVKVQAHVAYQTQYHIVWIPKYRRRIFVEGVKEYLEKTIQTIVSERYPDVYIVELNIQIDHVHALIEIPPKYSVSSVVGYIKGATARSMRMHFEFLRRARGLWSDGFFVGTVGVNEATIKQYIRYQDKQERGQATLASV
jgi:putative transposase